MKTLFVCAESRIEDHVGEEYDEIVEVGSTPTTDDIQEWANRIKDRIRKLAHQMEKEGNDKRIEVILDGPSPYNAMLVNLQVIMPDEEGIELELPYLDRTVPTTEDPEALEILSRLDKR